MISAPKTQLITVAAILALVLFGGCVAQSNPSPTEQETQAPIITPTIQETLLPGRDGPFFHLKGTGNGSSQPFTLDTARSIQLDWKQTGLGPFILSIRNLDPAMIGTRYEHVTFDFTVGPSQGNGTYRFVAGEYVIEIESNDADWELELSSSEAVFTDTNPDPRSWLFSGGRPGVSETFELNGIEDVTFEWIYQGEEIFQFLIIPLSPDTPPEDSLIVIESSQGPLDDTISYLLDSGTYFLDIQLGNGAWEIKMDYDPVNVTLEP